MISDLIPIFIAGIVSGGLGCFALQGGLLASVLPKKNDEDPQSNSKTKIIAPVVAFISAKFIIYCILGAMLGAFGSLFKFNVQMQGVLTLLAGVYMLGVAANLLELHGIFRYLIIQPPFFVQRKIRQIAKGKEGLATPAMLGFFTVVIPCATTLAVEAAAIASASALKGALIMGTFVVASSWVFIMIGLVAQSLSQKSQNYFNRLTALILVVLAVLSIKSSLVLLQVPTTAQVAKVAGASKNIDYEVQKIHINVTSQGYETSNRVLQKNIPVEITLETNGSYSCANAFTIPSLNLMKVLPQTGTAKVTFTPTKSGPLVYSCSMGMYRGSLQYYENNQVRNWKNALRKLCNKNRWRFRRNTWCGIFRNQLPYSKFQYKVR